MNKTEISDIKSRIGEAKEILDKLNGGTRDLAPLVRLIGTDILDLIDAYEDAEERYASEYVERERWQKRAETFENTITALKAKLLEAEEENVRTGTLYLQYQQLFKQEKERADVFEQAVYSFKYCATCVRRISEDPYASVCDWENCFPTYKGKADPFKNWELILRGLRKNWRKRK